LDQDRIRTRHERFRARIRILPKSHAAAGWQINAHALELEREYGMQYASDTRGYAPFWPMLEAERSTCVQLPTTLPTFDELLGRDGVDESSIADAVFRLSESSAVPSGENVQVFTLHAELEGMLLLDASNRCSESGRRPAPRSRAWRGFASLA